MTDNTVARLEQQVAALLEENKKLAAATNGAAAAPDPPTPGQLRAGALQAFNQETGLHDLTGIGQRGRDPDTARFTLHFAGGVDVRIGTITTLWSQAELAKVLAVAIGRVPLAVKPADWRAIIGLLVAHVVDVDEAPDEAFEASVRDWLARYAERAVNGNTDHTEAAALRAPFTKLTEAGENELYVSATEFATAIRRQWDPHIKNNEIRTALSDIGYQVTHISYYHGHNGNKTRSSASYFHGPHPGLPATE